MAAGTLTLRQLEAEAKALVHCPVCLEQFNVPKVLPCQHTFCLGCLEGCLQATNSMRLLSFSISNFPCPTCRKVSYVPVGGLSRLPTDIKITQIADLWRKVESLESLESSALSDQYSEGTNGDVKLPCGVCVYQNAQRTADCYCIQCSRTLCSRCFDQHTRTSLFREHSVVSLEASTRGDALSTADKCEQHSKNSEYYCQECQRSLCSVCVLLPSHEKHTIGRRSSQLNSPGDRSSFLSDLLDGLNRRSEELAKGVKSLDQLRKEVVRMTYESEKEMESSFRQAKQTINSMKDRLGEELKAAKEEKFDVLAAAEKKFSEGQNSARKLADVLRRRLQNPKDSRQKEEDLLRRITEELQKPYPVLDPSLINCTVFVPDVEISLGEIQAVPLEIPSEIRTNGNSTVSISENRSLKKQTRIKRLSSSVKDLTSTGLRHTKESHEGKKPVVEDFKETSRRSEDRKDRVLQSLVRTLSVRASRGSSSSAAGPKSVPTDAAVHPEIIQQHVTGCRDCCFLENDQLLVTTKSSLATLDVRTLAVVKSFDGSTMKRPWGLSNYQSSLILSSVLITDHERGTVNLLRSDGTVKTVDVGGGTVINTPTGIAVTRSGQYVITDTCAVGSSSSSIGLYAFRSGKLHLVRRLAAQGSGDGEVLKASYVAVDSSDRVLVADSGNRSVKIFDLEGSQLLKFNSRGWDGQDVLPQGIATDAEANIFVADQSTGCVALYSSDGQLINDCLVQNLATPWGIRFDPGQKLLAVATDGGLHVQKL